MTSQSRPPEANRLHPVSKFLVLCSGADPELLERNRTEIATYAGLGGTVMATTALAFASAWFALSLATSSAWWLILTISTMWALIIFNLDRWLLASFRKLSNQFWTILSLVPRVALAVLIGVIISEPMVLQIFDAEIEEELRDIGEDTRQVRLEAISTGPESIQIAEKRVEIAGLESRIGQTGDSELLQLQAEIAEQRTFLDEWEGQVSAARTALLESQASLEEEVIDGCADGQAGCVPGNGPIANQKRREVEIREQELLSIEERVVPNIDSSNTRIAQLVEGVDARRSLISEKLTETDNEFGQQIRVLNEEIDELEALQSQLRGNINDGDIEFGILARIDALEQLEERSSNVKRFHQLLTLLFIAIDTIPIIGKWLMTLGSKRPYEILKQAEELKTVAGVVETSKRIELDGQVRDATTIHLATTQAANEKHFINHWATIERNMGQAQLAEREKAVAPPGYRPVPVKSLPPVDRAIVVPPTASVTSIETAAERKYGWPIKAGAAALILAVVGLTATLVLSQRSELALPFTTSEADETTSASGVVDTSAPAQATTTIAATTTTPAAETTVVGPEVAADTIEREEMIAEPAGDTATSDESAAELEPTETEKAPEGPGSSGQNVQLASLEALIGDPDSAQPAYEREAFNEGQDEDSDCLATRHEILFEQGQDVEVADCKVVSGLWDDPFSGLKITDPAELEVDHVVSLADAWESGAWAFTPEKLSAFGNSTTNLNAIHGPENSRKGSLGPADYSPANDEQSCAYLTQYAAVKTEWNLSITQIDFDAVASGLANCTNN